jgi:hypothetical protein
MRLTWDYLRGDSGPLENSFLSSCNLNDGLSSLILTLIVIDCHGGGDDYQDAA